MSPSIHVYIFEAKSVQSWLFAGGKLRDAVGGSALLDGLARWASDTTARASREGEEHDVSDIVELAERQAGVVFGEEAYLRRAGGGLIIRAHSLDDLKRFRACWTFLVAQRAPGLAFEDALGTGSGDHAEAAALDAARAAISDRFRHLPDPMRANPWTVLAPRTGRAALSEVSSVVPGERQDAATRARRRYLPSSRENYRVGRDDPVGARFYKSDDVLWPNEMDEEDLKGFEHEIPFPFVAPDHRMVGLLHADANFLGQTLIGLRRTGLSGAVLSRFSRLVADCVGRAAQRASENTLAPWGVPDGNRRVLPARPILLGGDDLTILLRGDRAVPFAATFMKAFTEETQKALDELRQTLTHEGVSETALAPLPDGLSAGAGIVFVKSRQPFAQVHTLCESVARFAKDEAKKHTPQGAVPPSTLAFHRVTTSAIPESYTEGVVRRELSLSGGEAGPVLTMNPYIVDEAQAEAGSSGVPSEGLAPLSAVRALAASFADEGMARGPARKITAELLEGDWYRPWARMLSVAEEQTPDGVKAFADAMRKLGCTDGDSVAGGLSPWNGKRTPLLDALSLRAAEKAGDASLTEAS